MRKRVKGIVSRASPGCSLVSEELKHAYDIPTVIDALRQDLGKGHDILRTLLSYMQLDFLVSNTRITFIYNNYFTEDNESTKLWLLLDSFEFDGFHVLCANLSAAFPSGGDVDVRVYGLPCLLRAIANKACRVVSLVAFGCVPSLPFTFSYL